VSHWTFVALAYAASLTGTIGLGWSSLVAMRRAEALDQKDSS